MKLTNWIRDAIVANAVEKAGINKAYADYREERQQWACAVADESIGGAEAAALLEEANKKITRIVKSLPESLQSELRAGPLEGTVFASFGGMRTRINEWPGHRPAKTGGGKLRAQHQGRPGRLEGPEQAIEGDRHTLAATRCSGTQA